MDAYDEWVDKAQYGFRKSKSTAQAIHLARRLIDQAEMEGKI